MLQKKFVRSTETPLISFNFTDIVNGTGVVNFYLHSTYDESESYALSQDAMYSNSIEVSGASTSDSFTKELDVDFDSDAFSTPMTITGNARMNMTFTLNSTADEGSGHQAYIIAKLRKYDGTTETEIADAKSETLDLTSKPEKKIINLEMPITETLIKKGELIRVTIEGWIKQETGEACYMAFGFDPLDRDGVEIVPSTDDPTTTTTSIIKIPFKVNI